MDLYNKGNAETTETTECNVNRGINENYHRMVDFPAPGLKFRHSRYPIHKILGFVTSTFFDVGNSVHHQEFVSIFCWNLNSREW